jgi:hypothetical protein
VFIINGISGKVVYKYKETNINTKRPIDMVIAENFCVTSFVRTSQTTAAQEISVVELYQSRIEQDVVKLLKDYYISKADRLTQTEFSSYSLDSPVVSHMSYLITIDIKKLALTTSTSHISTKSLVIITSMDQLYAIDHIMFTARRKTVEELKIEEEKAKELPETGFGKYNLSTYEEPEYEVKSKDFPTYDGVIPHINAKFISYEIELANLRNVISFSTKLESTSAVLAFGHDLFYARVTPEHEYQRQEIQRRCWAGQYEHFLFARR